MEEFNHLAGNDGDYLGDIEVAEVIDSEKEEDSHHPLFSMLASVSNLEYTKVLEGEETEEEN